MVILDNFLEMTSIENLEFLYHTFVEAFDPSCRNFYFYFLFFCKYHFHS
jgi:hypothetical protein